MDVLESQHTGDLKEDHAAVVSLGDHLGLRLSGFNFLYRHTFVHPVLGMIMATLLLYAILYLYLTESAPCPQFQVEANLYSVCRNSFKKQIGGAAVLSQLYQDPLPVVRRDVDGLVSLCVRQLISSCAGDMPISSNGVLQYFNSPSKGLSGQLQPSKCAFLSALLKIRSFWKIV